MATTVTFRNGWTLTWKVFSLRELLSMSRVNVKYLRILSRSQARNSARTLSHVIETGSLRADWHLPMSRLLLEAFFPIWNLFGRKLQKYSRKRLKYSRKRLHRSLNPKSFVESQARAQTQL